MIAKKYYTIGEVAKIFSVSTSLVRYWEKKIKQLQPQNHDGIRKYTEEDIEKFKQAFTLIKKHGYTLRGAQAVLKTSKQAHDNSAAIIKNLENVKAFLEICYQRLL